MLPIAFCVVPCLSAPLFSLRSRLFLLPISRLGSQDSGGPLWSVDVERGGKGFVQYGVVSSAIGSKRYPCDSSWPTVFMRTSYYYNWIDSTVGSKMGLL